jgi:hypothetical protein
MNHNFSPERSLMKASSQVTGLKAVSSLSQIDNGLSHEEVSEMLRLPVNAVQHVLAILSPDDYFNQEQAKVMNPLQPDMVKEAAVGISRDLSEVSFLW